jgi:hypothetical protein
MTRRKKEGKALPPHTMGSAILTPSANSNPLALSLSISFSLMSSITEQLMERITMHIQNIDRPLDDRATISPDTAAKKAFPQCVNVSLIGTCSTIPEGPTIPRVNE